MLTVETGEGLANSDSLVTLAEVRAFALSRGSVVSSDDTLLEPQVRVAHDYLLSLEERLQGSRAVEGQALPYPRAGVVLYGVDVDEATVPVQAKNVICQLVIEGLTRDALPSADGRVVTQEIVGPLSTTYANSGAAGALPSMPRVDAFLAPLLLASAGRLSSIRV